MQAFVPHRYRICHTFSAFATLLHSQFVLRSIGLRVEPERHEPYICISCVDRHSGNHSGHAVPTQAVPQHWCHHRVAVWNMGPFLLWKGNDDLEGISNIANDQTFSYFLAKIQIHSQHTLYLQLFARTGTDTRLNYFYMNACESLSLPAPGSARTGWYILPQWVADLLHLFCSHAQIQQDLPGATWSAALWLNLAHGCTDGWWRYSGSG